MIVQPNFLDHWKTRMLQTELSDDPLSPTYILRLWGHCQEQKTHRFPKLSAAALAAICCYKGSPEVFWLAMQNSGFVTVKNDVVEAHEWDTYNASLITSWKNGKRGGRPRKPTGYPRATQVKPEPNPLETDREEKIEKIEKIEVNGRSAKASPPSDAEWLASLASNEAYAGINIGAEYGKMTAWCGANHKQPTRRRFVNWLNRVEKPLPRAITIARTTSADAPPENWQDKLARLRPGNTYDGAWSTLPDSIKEQVRRVG